MCDTVATDTTNPTDMSLRAAVLELLEAHAAIIGSCQLTNRGDLARCDAALARQQEALKQLSRAALSSSSSTTTLPESAEAARARILALLTVLAEAHEVLWTESPYMAADIRQVIEENATVYGIRVSQDRERIELDAADSAPPLPPRPESCLRCRGAGTDRCQRCAGSGLEPVAPYLRRCGAGSSEGGKP